MLFKIAIANSLNRAIQILLKKCLHTVKINFIFKRTEA